MEAKLLSTIEIRPNRSGQPRVYIAGTRTRVQDIYVLSEIRGLDPNQIVAALPGLTLGQVHAALSYYWDHPDSIRQEIEEDRAFADEMKQLLGRGRAGETPLSQDGSDDQVPPG